MPHVDEESKFTKVMVAFREWLPTVKPYLAERYAFVRETPGLVWRLPEVRYTALALGVVSVVSILQFAGGCLSFAPEGAVQPLATTGDFHVICTNEQCRKRFVINRKFKFDDFPVACPICKQETGRRALRCRSKTCRGQLVPTEIRGGDYVCQECDKVVKRE